MSREIQEDFHKLEVFIKNYKLDDSFQDQDYSMLLKQMHKPFFSFVSFISELNACHDKHDMFVEQSVIYLNESVSDIAHCVFCWLHGAYKPASMSLRSAVETFIRAFAGNSNSQIHKEKNMYSVFELSRMEACFSSQITSTIFSKIKGIYSTLCKTVHSSGEEDLSQLSALKLFPLFDKDKAASLSLLCHQVVEMMLMIIYHELFTYCWNMHHVNRKNFFKSISKENKRLIYELCADV